MEPAAESEADYRCPRWVRDELGFVIGEGIRIGVVDSGCDANWNQPQIRPGVGLAARDQVFVLAPSTDDRDLLGHGTACIELILRMTPGVEIYPIRIFDSRLETSVELIAAALEWAVEHRLDVVNLSLGTILERSLRTFYGACEMARRSGVIIVSAVHMARGWSYPAVFENAIGVQAGRFASAFDYEYRPEEAVECVAQGGCKVRWLGKGSRFVFGTSFAAPHVTAMVALLRQRFPGCDLDRVRELLARYALGGPGREAGGERKASPDLHGDLAAGPESPP